MVAPVNGYCTLADLKSADILNTPTANTDDQYLCDLITAASRSIDNFVSRHFYQSTASETRYFTTRNEERCFLGDYVSLTAVITDTQDGARTYPFTWASTDYDMWPFDAATTSEPYRYIDITPHGVYRFPIKIPKGVKITGVFGWPAVPDPIAKACLLWSARLFNRMKTPLGVSSMSALGQVMLKIPLDQDITGMIGTYRAPAI